MTDKEIRLAIKAVHDKHNKNDGEGHAEFGPSTLERVVECPGSVQASRGIPRRPGGPDALEGSLAHLALELLSKLEEAEGSLAARKRLNKFFPMEMVDHAFETFCKVVKDVPAGAIRMSEQKVDISHFTKKGQYGTLDIAIVEEFGRLTIRDFKYGRGVVVEPKGNIQLIAYALGLSKKFDHNFAEVELGISQPRIDHKDGPDRSHVMSMGALLKYEKKIKTAVVLAEGKNPPFNAGEHCRWCPAKATCPEIGRKKVKEAAADFDEILDVNPKDLTRIEDLDKRLPKLLVAFAHVRTYMKAVEDYAEDKLVRGEKIKGFAMVDKDGRRHYKNERATATEAKKTWGPIAFAPATLLPPAQLEKVLAVEYDPKTIKKWVAKRVEMVSSGKKLGAVGTKKDSNEFGEIAEEGKKRK